MKVAMKNPKTGEIKEVKVGWSWTLFLFSGFFGLPLFLRRLHVWGAIFLVFWVSSTLIVPGIFTEDDGVVVQIGLFLVSMGLNIFIAIKGNEMTAKNYLENGWTFVEPESELTKLGKMRWGITV